MKSRLKRKTRKNHSGGGETKHKSKTHKSKSPKHKPKIETKKFQDGIYTGELKNNERNGQGRMKYNDTEDFETFEGIWHENDKISGKMVYANGDIFEGEYEGDQRKKGKMIYENGDIYDGEWRGDFQDNERFGDGKMIYKNGDIYEGLWKYGKKNGHGKMVYKNGKVYEGPWEDDHIGPKPKEEPKVIYKYDIRKSEKIKTSVYFRINDIVTRLHTPSMQIDVEPHGHTYKEITKRIDKMVQDGLLCKGLSHTHISGVFDKADAVFVVHSSDILPNKETILGFALVQFLLHEEAFYVNIICSHKEVKGAGEFLLKKMEEISRKLSKKYIKLDSVNSAITFYEKFGFVKDIKTCNHMCLMIKRL
jgi:hypothetical protein